MHKYVSRRDKTPFQRFRLNGFAAWNPREEYKSFFASATVSESCQLEIILHVIYTHTSSKRFIVVRDDIRILWRRRFCQLQKYMSMCVCI